MKKLFALIFCLTLSTVCLSLKAQSTTSGDLAGTVTDASGAAIPGASVKITSSDSGATKTTTTGGAGTYRFSLLQPGTYKVEVTASGFSSLSQTVLVAQGKVIQVDAKLPVGQSTTVVDVSAGNENILNTEDANLSTSFTLEQLQALPNPGGDITYAAQTAPGVVMNTSGGDGNFSVFGLPGTSNNFTVNGMQVNDPFLNLNNSGPSNLLLGLNDIADVNVVTNAYDASFGSFGGAQVNATSRDGTNKFHGDLRYWWNGDSLNANNWFFNNSGVGRPFANSNQYAANIGGPIIKDKTFFFVNYEGLDFITSSENSLLLPSPAFQAATVGNNGQCSDASSTLYLAGNGSECTFYQQIFSIYNSAPNYSKATVNTSNTDELILNIPAKIRLQEQLLTARVDQVLGANDKAFIHFKYDKGTQPTYNDPFNTAFNIQSVQPDYEGQISETHTFGGHAVNQFLVTGSYYSAIFKSPNQAAANALLPITLNFSDIDGYFSDLNPDGFIFPQGRNVTQYQIADDFSYNIGKHTIKAGVAFKKDDVSDHDTGELTTPLLLTDGSGDDFQNGYVVEGIENFPTKLNVPISLYTLGFYVQDDWKISPKFSLNAGLRIERNSNPSCKINCLSNLGENFSTLAASGNASPATPYNQQIHAGLNKAFINYQAFEAEPRIGFNYAPNPKLVVRGGFGLFTDVFPATIADTELFNAPLTPEFTIYGPAVTASGNATIAPAGATSVNSEAASANQSFQTGYAGGGSFNSISAANPLFTAPSITSVASRLKYPTYNEYNLQVQYAFTKSDSVQLGYVGNTGYHEPVQNENLNAYGLAPFPTTGPTVPSFGEVTQIQSNAVSNYNGLILTYLHRGGGLSTQLNYTYSHNLDEISNGGLLPFGGASITTELDPNHLHGQYGNSDYDVRSYLNGNLVYDFPNLGGPSVIGKGWEVSATLFLHTGLPFTPTQPLSNFLGNAGSTSAPLQLVSKAGTSFHCSGAHVNNSNTALAVPCITPGQFYVLPDNAATVTQPVSNSFLGVSDRNQFTGPGYFDGDLSLFKSFHIPLSEATQLKLGITGYNLLNHPNFATPVADESSSLFGLSTSTVSPPTSIYGAFLGGDASVRIIQLSARFDF